MKFGTIMTAVALVSTASIAQAQDDKSAEFTAMGVKAHVDFLADDLLEGRDAGTRGYDIAAKYVATRFEALGLKPAANGDWYQQVAFRERSLDGPDASVTINGTKFLNGKDILIGPSAVDIKQSVSGETVFAGYGLDLPAQGFNDYAGLDVKGKFVVVLSGYPKGTPSDLGAHLSREKLAMAQAHGAIGVITIRTRETEKTFAWDRIAKGAKQPGIGWVSPDGKPWMDAPNLRANATLGTIATNAMFADVPKKLKAALDLADKKGGKPKGFALKANITVERESKFRDFTSPNVLAILPGSDPALANEYVVLMAHLDHVGMDPTKEGDKISNGAMDNAAGIAAMLEVARVMATSSNKPRRSILFAAVTAEEDGLLGSQYLAKNPVIGNGKIAGVVNLDMPVLLYDFTDVIAFGAEHSTLGPIVEKAVASANVTLASDPMPEQGLFTRSDHYRFVQAGIPSVFLMTGFANGGEKAFRDFLATHYHKVSDQTDLPINWQAGAKFAKINYLIASEIANEDAVPRWYKDSFFGKIYAPEADKADRPVQK